MGGEFSLEKDRNRSGSTNVRDGQVHAPPEHQKSVERLSDDFKQYLREKQDEFKQLVLRHQQLRVEIKANELAHNSVLRAYINKLNEVEQKNLNQAAEVIAWKSIAIGAEAAIRESQTKS